MSLSDDETMEAILKVFTVSNNLTDTERPYWEYAVRNGVLLTQRVLLEKWVNHMASSWYSTPRPEHAFFKQKGRSITLGVGTPGRLDTLHFLDDMTSSLPIGIDDVEITVKAAGLNLKT